MNVGRMLTLSTPTIRWPMLVTAAMRRRIVLPAKADRSAVRVVWSEPLVFGFDWKTLSRTVVLSLGCDGSRMSTRT